MKKILALMMILMMLSALTLTSGAANTKQEEPPVNFDAVVKEFYKEGEEVHRPRQSAGGGKHCVCGAFSGRRYDECKNHGMAFSLSNPRDR